MSRQNPRVRRTNPNLPLVGTTNGVVMYVIEGRIEGQMTVNTFMYSAAVPNPSSALLNTLLTNISTNLFAKFKNCVSADWTCFREQLKVVHRNDIATVQSNTNLSITGGRPAGHEPTEVAGIVLRVSATKGQHGRGRLSFPGICTADVSSSNWTSGALATALGLFTVAALNTVSDGTNTWTHCIGQRTNVSPKLIIGFAPITTYLGTQILGTVRRRKIGRGK